MVSFSSCLAWITTVELSSRWAELAWEKLSLSRWTFSADNSRLPSLDAVAPPKLNACPVSYTHLDVYKRQVCNRSYGYVAQGSF